MKRLSRWRPLSLFRLGLLRFGGVVLAGAMLLALALAVSGLMLPASAASAAPFRPPPRPTATPTQPRSTPTPRPTATTAPSPTATARATATSTAHPGANTGGTDAAGSTQSQSADSLLWSSLMWGLGAVIIALLGFGACIWLFTRRAARERQQQSAFPDHARAPSRERLNQLYQRLPSHNMPQPPPTEEKRGAAETTLTEEDTTPRWSAPSEVSWPSTPRPPQWLTDAGILKSGPLKDSAKEPPPEAPAEP
ncbi:MAG TPA: hypothetical protein VF099_12690 [Ktedonobacterales bacterium]